MLRAQNFLLYFLRTGVKSKTARQIFALALLYVVERGMDITEVIFLAINLLSRLQAWVNGEISVESDFVSIDVIERK